MPELLRVLDFDPAREGDPAAPDPAGRDRAGVPDAGAGFATSVLMLDGEHLGHEVDAPCRHDGPQILVCTQGSVVVRAKSDEVRIERGSSAWVAADDGPIRLEAQEPTKLFRATVGL